MAKQRTKRVAPARLIVWARTGRWAVALRRELAETGIRVWETRTLVECWEELVESPASFLVVELLEGNVHPLLARMMRLPREFPTVRIAMVADRSLADYEGLLREAGAVHFVCSPRQLGPMAKMANRHLAITGDLRPPLASEGD